MENYLRVLVFKEWLGLCAYQVSLTMKPYLYSTRAQSCAVIFDTVEEPS